MYIEKIKSPTDLKKLDLKELQVVADENQTGCAEPCEQAWRSCGAEPGIRGGYRGASLRF